MQLLCPGLVSAVLALRQTRHWHERPSSCLHERDFLMDGFVHCLDQACFVAHLSSLALSRSFLCPPGVQGKAVSLTSRLAVAFVRPRVCSESAPLAELGPAAPAQPPIIYTRHFPGSSRQLRVSARHAVHEMHGTIPCHSQALRELDHEKES